LGLHRYDDIIICARAYLEAHRPAVVGFLRGYIMGLKANAKDPKVAAELVVKKYGADYGWTSRSKLARTSCSCRSCIRSANRIIRCLPSTKT